MLFTNSGSQTRTDDNLINSQVLYQLSYAGITAWQRPILAGSDPPTTFGVLKLNFCVRHGNRCILQAIITTLTLYGFELALSKLNNIALLPNLTA